MLKEGSGQRYVRTSNIRGAIYKRLCIMQSCSHVVICRWIHFYWIFAYFYILLIFCICNTKFISVHRNDFAKVSKNLVRYKSENNFVRPSKYVGYAQASYWLLNTFYSVAYYIWTFYIIILIVQ